MQMSVGGGVAQTGHWILPIDPDRLLDYVFYGNWYSVHVNVVGWYV